jgi:hypothetical protein
VCKFQVLPIHPHLGNFHLRSLSDWRREVERLDVIAMSGGRDLEGAESSRAKEEGGEVWAQQSRMGDCESACKIPPFTHSRDA